MARYRKIKRAVEAPSSPPRTGLDRYECNHHGWLCDALQGRSVKVWCPCGRIGKKVASGPERKEENNEG